jgi:hypothetical protein
VNRDEERYRCRLRARSAILKASWPLTPADHDEIVATIQRHTDAPLEVVECAYNDELAEIAEDLRKLDRDADRTVKITDREDGKMIVTCPHDFGIRFSSRGLELVCPNLRRAAELSEAIRLYINAKDLS